MSILLISSLVIFLPVLSHPLRSLKFSLAFFHRIALLARNHATHAALRIGNVALVAGNDVHVVMKDGLTSGFANVGADVIAENQSI